MIFGQSSYSGLKIKKKKKNSGTWVHGTRVPWKNSSGTQVLHMELEFQKKKKKKKNLSPLSL